MSTTKHSAFFVVRKNRTKRRSALFVIVGLVLAAAITGFLIFSDPQSVAPTFADGNLVQSATNSEQSVSSIRTTFQQMPAPGHLLVAVIANRHAARIDPPAGWKEAINESGFSPGQAIFYKIAGSGESKDVVLQADRRTNLGLHIYEYRGVDPKLTIDAVSSDAGESKAIHSGEASVHREQALVVAGFVSDELANLRQPFEDGFTLRNLFQLKGSGGMTYLGADQVVRHGNRHEASALLTKHGHWRGQVVSFGLLPGIEAAQQGTESVDLIIDYTVSNAAPARGEEVEYTVTVRNDSAFQATNVLVHSLLPFKFNFAGASFTQGEFFPGLGIWRLGDLGSAQEAELVYTAVIDGESGTSYIQRSTIIGSDQPDPDETNNEAFTAVDIEGALPEEDGECTQISDQSFAINGGASDTGSRTVSLDAQAAGADFVLIGEDERRQLARYFELGTISYELSEGTGTKTLFAWFSNPCRSAFVTRAQIAYDPAFAPPPYTGFEEDDIPGIVVIPPGGEPAELPSLPSTGGYLEYPPGFLPPEVPPAEQPDPEPEPEPEVPPTPLIPSDCRSETAFVSFMERDAVSFEVRSLQNLLQCLGYFPSSLQPTAIFGPVTERAVQLFQADNGIEPVGWVGPSTRSALNIYQ